MISTPFEHIAWDYDASSHSTHGHPLAPLREALQSAKASRRRRPSLGHEETAAGSATPASSSAANALAPRRE